MGLLALIDFFNRVQRTIGRAFEPPIVASPQGYHEIEHNFGDVAQNAAATFNAFTQLYGSAHFPRDARIMSALVANNSAFEVLVQEANNSRVASNAYKEVFFPGGGTEVVSVVVTGGDPANGEIRMIAKIRGCMCP